VVSELCACTYSASSKLMLAVLPETAVTAVTNLSFFRPRREDEGDEGDKEGEQGEAMLTVTYLPPLTAIQARAWDRQQRSASSNLK